MNILGVIAEFNPLHTGHEYLIRHLRRETGAAFCVVVMSGDYVQRGEPAFFPKSLRTRAALLSGADLVLELPVSISTGSAEYFAQGAVSLLDHLGCVNHLGFGSESGKVRGFLLAGEMLSEEPEAYRNFLRRFLNAGMSFPKARYEALSLFLKTVYGMSEHENSLHNKLPGGHPLTPPDIQDILISLESPNNILGAEYCKALYKLRSSIVPVTVRRLGSGYHEALHSAGEYSCTDDASDIDGKSSPAAPPSQTGTMSSPQYASASGLRKAFLSSPDEDERDDFLQHYVPDACQSLYSEALRQKQYVTFDALYLPLYYTLQYTDAETLNRYQDVTPAFSDRLLQVFRQCSSVTELCAAMKTKNLTSTRINRSLLHILLRITKEDVAQEKRQGAALYARILGFRRQAQPLLSEIRRRASIPLISKLADAPNYLSPPALAQLERTIKASELYRAALPGTSPGSEYTQNIIIL